MRPGTNASGDLSFCHFVAERRRSRSFSAQFFDGFSQPARKTSQNQIVLRRLHDEDLITEERRGRPADRSPTSSSRQRGSDHGDGGQRKKTQRHGFTGRECSSRRGRRPHSSACAPHGRSCDDRARPHALSNHFEHLHRTKRGRTDDLLYRARPQVDRDRRTGSGIRTGRESRLRDRLAFGISYARRVARESLSRALGVPRHDGSDGVRRRARLVAQSSQELGPAQRRARHSTRRRPRRRIPSSPAAPRAPRPCSRRSA